MKIQDLKKNNFAKAYLLKLYYNEDVLPKR